uniref:Uncharacterized protein n=1 Tax=Picea glauca TaxID=3330 RepID=A0A117NIR2_PICGL|nr:hypothetical protein ABT39_MTgene176 [Picea glauca]
MSRVITSLFKIKILMGELLVRCGQAINYFCGEMNHLSSSTGTPKHLALALEPSIFPHLKGRNTST